MWSGIAAYVFHYEIELMFGCASLPGTDPDALAVPLSYLYHHHLAPPALRARALPERYVEMRRLDAAGSSTRRARWQALPPLIKGYLRLGGFVGDGAVIDEQFNTTDVCIVVKTDLVTEKYTPPLRAAIERNMGGVERMGSTTLRLWRLASYLAFTLLLMPVQAIGLALRQRWVVGFPRFYHRCCCYILGLRVRRIGRPTATRRSCLPPTTSPISTSRSLAR